MHADTASTWPPRLSALLAAAALGASVLAWVLHWPGASVPADGAVAKVASSSTTLAPSNAPVEFGAVARALGAPATATPSATAVAPQTYRLTGFVAGSNGTGAALIAVRDQAPRAYHVGSRVDDALVLQAVERHRVRLGPDLRSPASLTLELPTPAVNTAP